MKYIPIILITAALIASITPIPPPPPVEQLATQATAQHIEPIAEPYYIIERLQELTTEVETEPAPPPPRYTPTAWERKLMAALAEQEDSTSAESMQAVVEVILNRIDSTHHTWANCKTAEDVIYQAGWCNGVWVEQYQGATRLANAEPSNAAFEAVDRACQGDVLVGDNVLFHAEKSVENWKIANDIEVVKQYGMTNFWRMK